jgi:hypothetical protein
MIPQRFGPPPSGDDFQSAEQVAVEHAQRLGFFIYRLARNTGYIRVALLDHGRTVTVYTSHGEPIKTITFPIRIGDYEPEDK